MASVTGADTLLLLQAGSARKLEILSVKVGNESNDTAEQLGFGVGRIESGDIRDNTDMGGTDVSTDIAKTEPASPASTVVQALKGIAASPGPGTVELLDVDGQPNLSGYRLQEIPEGRIFIDHDDAFIVKLLTAPSSTDFRVTVKWREI